MHAEGGASGEPRERLEDLLELRLDGVCVGAVERVFDEGAGLDDAAPAKEAFRALERHEPERGGLGAVIVVGLDAVGVDVDLHRLDVIELRFNHDRLARFVVHPRLVERVVEQGRAVPPRCLAVVVVVLHLGLRHLGARVVPVEQDEAQERGPLHEVQEHREGEDGALAGDEVVVLVVVVKLGRDGHQLLEHALAFLLPAGRASGGWDFKLAFRADGARAHELV